MKFRVLLGWAVGSFSSSVLVNAIGLLHLRFMTDSLGLSIALAGGLTAAAKIYDAILDPIVGMASDRTRTRFGRYRPYLALGSLLAALSMVLLFNVPAFLSGGALTAYVALSLLFFSTAYTLYRIPYLALGRSLTQSFAERSRLMAGSVYGTSCGSLLAMSAAPFLLAQMGSDRAGHGIIAIILALFIAIGGLSTFLLIGEEKVEAQPAGAATRHLSMGAAVRAVRENKPFQCLVAFKVILFSGMAIHVTAIPYYFRHVLGSSDAGLGSLFLIQTLVMMAAQFLWVPLAGRIGRRNALLAAGLLDMVAKLAWAFIPAGHPFPWIQLCGALSGLAASGVFLGLYTVLTDTMDHARRQSGGPGREGILAGVFVMVEKATAAGGTFLFSLILGWAGYVSSHDAGVVVQSANVGRGLFVAIAILPACFSLLACLCLRNMRLEDRPATR